MNHFTITENNAKTLEIYERDTLAAASAIVARECRTQAQRLFTRAMQDEDSRAQKLYSAGNVVEEFRQVDPITRDLIDTREIPEYLAAHELDPASLPELMKLFPTLAHLTFPRQGTPADLLAMALALDLGAGALNAALFLCNALGEGTMFDLSRAIAKWDSAHRAGFREACRRLTE